MSWSSIPCCEEQNTRKEGGSKDGFNASVTLRCDWGQRFALAADIVGNHKGYPDNTLARAVSFDIAPFDSKATTSGEQLVYTDALVTIKYSSKQPDKLFEERLEPTIEFMTLDFKKFRWLGPLGRPILENEAPGRQLFTMALVREWDCVPAPLPPEILTLIGKVNDASYTSDQLGITFDEEELLFMPNPISRTVMSDFTSPGFKLVLKFAYKPGGWNKFWYSETQDYESIYIHEDGSGPYKNYPPEDFTALLGDPDEGSV